MNLIKNICKMVKGDVVADSSFYICFLDCIKCPEPLLTMIDNFSFHVPQKIFEEISKSKNSSVILDKKSKLKVLKKIPVGLGEVAKPFFSKAENVKGEDEILVLSYVYSHLGIPFLIILDEVSKRKLLLKYLPEVKSNLRGTIGFICDCYCIYEIFNKVESLDLLDKIERSDFWIKGAIIDEIRQKIANHKNE